MKMMRLAALPFAAVAVAGGLWLTAPMAQESDTTFLGNLISRALSTPAQRVQIGSVEGVLSSDSTIRNIVVSDRDGPWLKLDRARLVWSRLALLQRRLQVDKLEIGTFEILRKPLPNEAPEQVSKEPLLPELPVKVNIDDFQLQELSLGQPVLGTAARITASGAASLGAPSEGLNLRLDARRLDQPGGTFAARLSLVPQTNALTVSVNWNEPAGGLLSKVANLPGEPPVKLDLTGNGTLDAFAAKLAFTAGDTIGADGNATLNRQGTQRRLALDLGARIEGLLPPLAAPIFAGTTQLKGDVAFADDSAVNIAQLSVASQTARLDVGGTVSATQDLDLKVTARALPTQGEATVAGGAEIRRLTFDGTIVGPGKAPKIDAKLDLDDAKLPAGSLAKVAARFTATPSGDVTDAKNRIALVADASATGIALKDEALARAVGDRLTLNLRGSAGADGIADIETLDLKTQTATATYKGRIGNPEIRGRLTAQAPDLSRFGEMSGLALRGALDASFDLSGVPRDGRIEAMTDAKVTGFATGIAAADGLTGGQLNAAGTLLKLPAGGYGFKGFTLTGAHVSATADGTATVTNADIKATIDIPDVKRADPRASGRAQVALSLTGTTERPDAAIRATLSDGSLMERRVPRLALDVVAKNLTGLLDATVNLDGEIAQKPARGGLHAAKLDGNGWRVDGIDLTIGSATAKGGVTLSGENRASGQLDVAAKNLDDLSPLVLTKLTGDIAATFTLNAANGRQDAAIKARGQSLRFGASSLDRLDADISARDVYARPVIDGVVAIDKAVIGGQTISRIRFNAAGTDAGSDLNLTAAALGFDLATKARLVPGDRTRLDLASFEAKRGGRRIALAQPASFTFGDSGVDIKDFALAVETGRVTLDGRAGDALDLNLAIRALPLSAAEIVQPGLGLSGTVDGTAHVTGSSSAPQGDWRIKVARFVAAQTRSSGLPPIDVTASGRLADGRTSLDATVDAGRAGSLRASGSVPLGASGALDLSARGTLDVGIANSFLAVQGRRVTGSAALDVKVTGSVSAPQANGSVTLSGGSFTDAEQGVKLTAIAGRIAARGDTLAIERLSAATPNGGTLGVSGQVRLDPGAGFPGQIRLTGTRAQLVSSGLVTATANLNIDLAGPLAQRPRIAGRINLIQVDVAVPERLGSSSRPIEGTRFVKPTPQARAKIAADARKKGSGKRAASPFDAVLDLTIDAPNRIYVRGRGIDAELGGSLRVTGTLNDPVPIGAFGLRSGRFDLGSQRLNFAKANLRFTGELATPDLDFLAETQAGGVTARIGISGPANAPAFAFTSDPDLPQDEVLSRILFGKASGGLGPGQALQLAQIAAQFAGDGDGAFEGLRKSLGVEGLDVGLGGVGLQKAISDRLSVGVKTGVTPEENGISADLDITKHIRGQADVNAGGGASVGVGAEWEY